MSFGSPVSSSFSIFHFSPYFSLKSSEEAEEILTAFFSCFAEARKCPELKLTGVKPEAQYLFYCSF